jgi:hypothetical protein
LEEDMELRELSGELDPAKVDEWIDTLGDTDTPLENEDEVRVGSDEESTRAKVLKLLRGWLRAKETCRR